jgi:hypothetical protein
MLKAVKDYFEWGNGRKMADEAITAALDDIISRIKLGNENLDGNRTRR